MFCKGDDLHKRKTSLQKDNFNYSEVMSRCREESLSIKAKDSA